MLLPLLPKSGSIQAGPNGQFLSVDELASAVNARADEFGAHGLTSGKRLAVVPDRPIPFLIDMFAAWQCGAMAICLSPAAAPAELDVVERAVRPDLWSVPASTAPPTGASTLAQADPANRSRKQSQFIAKQLPTLDDPALVLMTSGTTTTPKGVVLSHRALMARLSLNIAHTNIGDWTVSLCPLPLHFGHGLIGNTLTPLMAGGHVILWPDAGLAGLAQLGQVIDDAGISFLSSVPALWQVVLRTAQRPAGSSLKRVHVGSAPLATHQWKAIADWAGTRHVVNMYGMTEAANWISGHDLAEGPVSDGLVGRPWGGVIAVRTRDGTIAPTGYGDILVSSPSLMLGYLDQPEMTTDSLDGAWLDTGDVGEIDTTGCLRLIGRTKFEINRAGIKIPAEEIDLLLQRHPAIMEACGFAMPDPVFGEAVAAAIVSEHDCDLAVDDVRDWCRGQIRADAVPSKLFVVERLPRSDRGKVQRDRVAALCLADRSNGVRS